MQKANCFVLGAWCIPPLKKAIASYMLYWNMPNDIQRGLQGPWHLQGSLQHYFTAKYDFLILKVRFKIVSEYDREITQSQTQTTPWHREEEPLNHHETPGRQIKQINQPSLPHQDDCNTRMDISNVQQNIEQLQTLLKTIKVCFCSQEYRIITSYTMVDLVEHC